MDKKIGIITKVDANHGSCIFDRSLTALLEKNLPGSKVEVLIDPFCRTRPFELLRALKINRQIPFYNLRRHIRLGQYSRKTVNRAVLAAFPSYSEIMLRLERENFDVIIPSKVVWDVTTD